MTTFIAGADAELIPVREIDTRVVINCPGPIFARIIDAFQRCVEN